MNNDLISRSALKEAFEKTVCIEPMPYAFVKQIIDNAPTVEQKYYERVIAQINPVIEARPQGEWIIHNKGEHNEWHECPYCNNHKKYYSRFCDYCGADMRKEKANGKS